MHYAILITFKLFNGKQQLYTIPTSYPLPNKQGVELILKLTVALIGRLLGFHVSLGKYTLIEIPNRTNPYITQKNEPFTPYTVHPAVPLNKTEYGVYGHLVIIYPKPYSIYLRGPVSLKTRSLTAEAIPLIVVLILTVIGMVVALVINSNSNSQ